MLPCKPPFLRRGCTENYVPPEEAFLEAKGNPPPEGAGSPEGEKRRLKVMVKPNFLSGWIFLEPTFFGYHGVAIGVSKTVFCKKLLF